MERVKKACALINLVNEYAYNGVGLFFVPITLIAMFEVVMRYFFNRPTIWAWDINLQFFSFIVVFGAGNTLFRGGHVVMDIFVSRISTKKRLIINLTVYIIFLIAAIFILKELLTFAWRSVLLRERASTLLAPIIYPQKVGIFIGFNLFFLQAISLFIRDLIDYAVMSREGKWK